MIYVNGYVVTEENDFDTAAELLKNFLFAEKLIVVKEDKEPMSQHELTAILKSGTKEIKLSAIKSSLLLREFKEELHTYILQVEQYVEKIRETENLSTVMNSFVQVTEALIEFSAVEEFLQKKLVQQNQLNDISRKALEQAEVGNNEYVLDLLEYELLPILHHFLDETNEVM